jgi:hypothetical protein
MLKGPVCFAFSSMIGFEKQIRWKGRQTDVILLPKRRSFFRIGIQLHAAPKKIDDGGTSGVDE